MKVQGYLIEATGDTPRYFKLTAGGRVKWVKNPAKAHRYARAQDAQRVIEHWRITAEPGHDRCTVSTLFELDD